MSNILNITIRLFLELALDVCDEFKVEYDVFYDITLLFNNQDIIKMKNENSLIIGQGAFGSIRRF